jgi:hypothetical protein
MEKRNAEAEEGERRRAVVCWAAGARTRRRGWATPVGGWVGGWGGRVGGCHGRVKSWVRASASPVLNVHAMPRFWCGLAPLLHHHHEQHQSESVVRRWVVWLGVVHLSVFVGTDRGGVKECALFLCVACTGESSVRGCWHYVSCNAYYYYRAPHRDGKGGVDIKPSML